MEAIVRIWVFRKKQVIAKLSLVRSMEHGVTGDSGKHVQKHVEKDADRDPENVIVHKLNMEARSAQEIVWSLKSA